MKIRWHLIFTFVWGTYEHQLVTLITFTCVEGWNWVATWYSTLLEMQVCIKWLPNTYPCLKHRWTSHGRPMLTFRLRQRWVLSGHPILTFRWCNINHWTVAQYSPTLEVWIKIQWSFNSMICLRCKLASFTWHLR
jgi:hypothetical protein